MREIPKIACINDLSGFGRCSLVVASSILSVMGLQPCLMPTAVLSNHTGYDSYTFLDFTQHMKPFYEQWEKLNLKFATIYTGFLGSEQQIDTVAAFIGLHPEAKILVDPVMGDDGKPYATYTPQMCEKMRRLTAGADMATPNVTEACILTDEQYQGDDISFESAISLCRRICAQGTRKVVLTGVQVEEDIVANVFYNRETGENFMVRQKKVTKKYPGTGDMFASVLCGELTRGADDLAAVSSAAKFVRKVAAYTAEAETRINDSVIYEPFLKELG